MNGIGFHLISGGLFALLLIPLIISYFLKLRRPRQTVSSLALWQSVLQDQRVNSPFQRFKKHLLLLLQILMLLFFVVSLMQPYWQSPADRADYLPILIDQSASMGTLTSDGKRRLDHLKEDAKALITGMQPGQRFCLIGVGETATKLSDFTDDQTELLAALEQIDVVPVASNLVDGLRMAQALSKTVAVRNVLLLTDGNVPERVDFDLPFEVKYQRSQFRGKNLGITELNARRVAFDRWSLFCRIDASPDWSGRAQMRLGNKDVEVASETLDLLGGSSERFQFDFNTTEEISLSLQLTSKEEDQLQADNLATIALPASRKLTAYCPMSLSSFRHALMQFDDLELNSDDRATLTEYDLVIGTDKQPLPAGRVELIAGGIPELLEDLVSATDQTVEIVDWNRTSSLLRHVQLNEVVIDGDLKFAAGTTSTQLEEIGYRVLALSRGGPLIVSDERNQNRRYHFLFDVNRSTLPYRVALPVMVTNLIEEAYQSADLSEVRSLACGVLPELKMKPTSAYSVTRPDGSTRVVTTDSQGRLSGVLANQIGTYTITGDDEQREIGVSLLSPLETSLASVEQLLFRELKVEASQELIESDRPMWRWLAWIGFVVLLLEWWVFQRPSSRSSS